MRLSNQASRKFKYERHQYLFLTSACISIYIASSKNGTQIVMNNQISRVNCLKRFRDAWNWCPTNMALRGFYRSGGSEDLGWLEEGVCCKPDDAAQLGDCYYEDIGLTFDNAYATARCHKQFYCISGIRTSACGGIQCIEELHCCKFL